MNAGAPSAPNPTKMTLLGFVTELLQSGNVVLGATLDSFTKEDLQGTAQLLERYHAWDAVSMPYQAPAFDSQAAVWAAAYICRALQFVMIRHFGEKAIAEHLRPYAGPHNDAAAYSADLSLRHLPSVYGLARSLSPTDPLVTNLQQTARDWPFSVVGIELETDLNTTHPSLQAAYADRVLAARDRKRARHPLTNLHIQAALGAHAARLWPDFEPILPEKE